MNTVLTLSLASALTVFGNQCLAQNALTLTGTPTAGRVRITAAMRPNPTRVNAAAGGAIAHPSCTGFTSARPALLLTVVPAQQQVRIAPAQLTTLVYALSPDGTWHCTVDATGIRSALEGPFTAGLWRVWLGSITAGAPSRTALTVAVLPTPAPTNNSADAGVDPVALGTNLANQVLGSLSGNNPPAQNPSPNPSQAPLQVPLQDLTRAGLDPQHLPGALDGLLRGNSAPWSNSTSPQLGQLGQLAQTGMAAGQLASVANALMGGQSPAGSTLNPTQLTQVTEMARRGMNSAELQRAVGQMLQSARPR